MKLKKKKRIRCYIYFWLDNRKPGPYIYCHNNRAFSFKYKPFYAGVGSNKYRPYEKHNKWFENVKNKIKKACKKPYIQKHYIGGWKLTTIYERYFIKLIGRRDLKLGPLTNLTNGGEGILGRKHSEKTKRKQSIAAKNRAPISEETRKKMSEAKKGNKYSLGNVPSRKTRKRMSGTHKGRKYALGKKKSKEARKNMSIAKSGKNHPMYGKHHTKETIKKMSNQEK